MKKAGIIFFILLYSSVSFAQNDSVVLVQIKNQILLNGQCYKDLKTLCKTIGNRLAGSPQAAQAINWGEKTLRAAGAEKIILQHVWVPHWVRGKEYLKIQFEPNSPFEKVNMLSLGNAVSTHNKKVHSELLLVENFDDFKKLSSKEVKGKIVFFNYRFRQDLINTFEGYGDAVKYRGATPALVAAKGGIGVIIRSISTGEDDEPHTGMTRYVDTLPKIPAVAIGNYTANRLELACQKNKVEVSLQTNCQLLDSVLSYNVIGELKGSQFPEEIITVGGHLDSWDVGEGAHDDGAGCVQSIEVLRTFKALNIKPKRTLRVVLFMNEENGAKGGKAYAAEAQLKHEKHYFALESDAGGFSPRGIGLEMPVDMKNKIKSWRSLFAPINVTDFEQEEGGTDISFLKNLNTPMAGLLPDPQRYFDIHHTQKDVFEAVNHRELKLGAVAMAYLVYLVSEQGLQP